MKLGELYKYKNDTECTVLLQPVLGQAFGEHTAVVDPDEKDLGPPVKHIVHAGYRPCLAVFIGEIEFMVKELDKSHNCLFRGTYVTKVLDRFGDELQHRPKNQAKTRFRSKVLNPILQRHLRGLTDYEAACVEEAVGKTTTASGMFYLKQDPLDESNRIAMMHNSLYVWPIRNSYVHSGKDELPDGAFQKTLHNTTALYAAMPEDWTAGEMSSYELRLITNEKIEEIYAELIAAMVSAPLFLINFGSFSSKYQDNDEHPPPSPSVSGGVDGNGRKGGSGSKGGSGGNGAGGGDGDGGGGGNGDGGGGGNGDANGSDEADANGDTDRDGSDDGGGGGDENN